jgi:galactokinase
VDGERVVATAPGRVNLIGDHTDYMGGLVLPMAIQLHTVVTGVRGGRTVEIHSAELDDRVAFELPVADPSTVEPTWGRYVAGVAAQVQPSSGFRGELHSSVPVGSGLSSSAALEVATALALGDEGTPLEVARRCQIAEQLATGVPCGIMDQLASTAGVAGHALLIDCDTLQVEPVRVPDDASVWVVHSGEPRTLAGSAYAQRRAECEAAEELVGRLPTADPSLIERIGDAVVRARARHVRSECERVRSFAEALRNGELARAGVVMDESHRSLRDDFEVSTARLDKLVDDLSSIQGVHGVRLTGAGFGGCVVALTDPDVELAGWRVVPSAGASLSVVG